MPFHKCTIETLDGAAVAQDVMVNVEESDRSGEREWFGTISGEHLLMLEAGAFYRLLLGDGRVGEFRVRRNTFAGGDNARAVSFRGTKPLTAPTL